LSRAGLLDVLHYAQQALKELNEKQAEHKHNMLLLIQRLKKSLHGELVGANISTFHIEPLMDLVNKAHKETLALFDGEEQAETEVTHVIQELQAAINR
jgi:hypothetical protein